MEDAFQTPALKLGRNKKPGGFFFGAPKRGPKYPTNPPKPASQLPLLGGSGPMIYKWLVTMVIISPLSRVVLLPNGLSMAFKWGWFDHHVSPSIGIPILQVALFSFVKKNKNNIWVFPKIVVPQIINNRVFPYKPSILGCFPIFGSTHFFRSRGFLLWWKKAHGKKSQGFLTLQGVWPGIALPKTTVSLRSWKDEHFQKGTWSIPSITFSSANSMLVSWKSVFDVGFEMLWGDICCFVPRCP